MGPPPPPPPLPQASVLLSGTKGWGGVHTRLRLRGWGCPNSYDWKESTLPTLSTLWFQGWIVVCQIEFKISFFAPPTKGRVACVVPINHSEHTVLACNTCVPVVCKHISVMQDLLMNAVRYGTGSRESQNAQIFYSTINMLLSFLFIVESAHNRTLQNVTGPCIPQLSDISWQWCGSRMFMQDPGS